MMPKLSIIIPTYNRYFLLKRAILSITNQKESCDVEIIIVDDCSEKTIDYIGEFNGHNIKFFRNENNGGVNYSRNKGIKESTGEWIAFLDDDDEYLQDGIFKILDTISEFLNKADILLFNCQRITSTGLSRTGYNFINDNKFTKSSYEAFIFKEGRGGDSHVVIRKDVFSDPNIFFPEDINGFESFAYVRMARKGYSIFHINQVVVKVHLEDENTVHLSGLYRKYPREYLKYLELFLLENYNILIKRKPVVRSNYKQLLSLSVRTLNLKKIIKFSILYIRCLFF